MSRVNHPDHYQTPNGLEAIDVIEAFFHDNFHLGNVFKYLARAGKKGDYVEDLQKAAWYLQREIDRHATETTTQAAKKELQSVIFGPLRQEKGGNTL
ncbi:DUF3310 domain-containing protein [Corynebacterium urealyticum]|uniref:DUF3310 domain-containing protein n=1 Tax=Corynebacterium urealyticum TaxID=43771 RepID=UPI00293E25D4|nr:DUF3310 domain-containing protein [Corynebacterium urealyticum]WOH94954.1 DUF3310 domain-containing protein [Corynebacterium urealyticum]